MIKIQGKIPREVIVACSGGVDSMAVVDFLSRNHTVRPLFVNHGTETSREAETFLDSVFGDALIKTYISTDELPKNTSQEEHWRNERYKIFHSMDVPVVTCHHLDDCTETWIWSSLNGCGKVIPYRNLNVIRPFRMNRKFEFVDWCNRKNIQWIEDKSNSDTKYMRNFIRHELMPKALVVNPGLYKVVAKIVKDTSVA
jgi:tRNA(Ile)-lysidine synthase